MIHPNEITAKTSKSFQETSVAGKMMEINPEDWDGHSHILTFCDEEILQVAQLYSQQRILWPAQQLPSGEWRVLQNTVGELFKREALFRFWKFSFYSPGDGEDEEEDEEEEEEEAAVVGDEVFSLSHATSCSSHPELSVRFKAADIKMINSASQSQAPIMPDHFLCALLTLHLRLMQMCHYEPSIGTPGDGATVCVCSKW